MDEVEKSEKCPPVTWNSEVILITCESGSQGTLLYMLLYINGCALVVQKYFHFIFHFMNVRMHTIIMIYCLAVGESNI